VELVVGCSFVFVAPAPTHAVMLVEPHGSETRRVRGARWAARQRGVEIEAPRHVDPYGNCRRRITIEPGRAEIEFTATVEASTCPDHADPTARMVDPADLPASVLEFLTPSRYCESDAMTELAWDVFSSVPRDWALAQAVCDWVHDRLAFRYGSSSPSLTAAAALDQGVGVCRDYAHLAIALYRALNVPARYVFGYLPDIGVPDPGTPMDFCAWTEVFIGGHWHPFDPRNNQRRIGRVVIGRGRDAADVAMVTSFGQLDLESMTVVAEISGTQRPRTALDVR